MGALSRLIGYRRRYGVARSTLWKTLGSIPGVAFGTPMLGATFAKIDVELPITETTGSVASAYLEYRKTSAVDTVLRTLPLYAFRPAVGDEQDRYGTVAALYGCCLWLDAGTEYEVRARVNDACWVRLGTVTTRSEIATAESILAGTPDRYVATGGSDAAAGTASGTAWATTQKAWSSTSAGQTCRFGPGYYGLTTGSRSSAGTFVAEYPAVDADGNEINVGNQAVLEPATVSAPTGTAAHSTAISSNPYTVAPWVQATAIAGTGQTLAGGTYDAPTTARTHGADGRLWVWAGPPVADISPAGLGQVCYGKTRSEVPKRIPFTDRDAAVAATVNGWAEIAYTNASYPHTSGCAYQDANGDLYLVMPDDAVRADGQPSTDPNDYWIKAGGEREAFEVGGADIRLCGFAIHCANYGVEIRHAAGASQRTIVDRCLIANANIGVRRGEQNNSQADPQNPALYEGQTVVQECRFQDHNLWRTDGQGVPWWLIKSNIYLENGLQYTSGNGYPVTASQRKWFGASECTAISGRAGGIRDVARRNVIDGYFNGINPCGFADGDGRYTGYGFDNLDNEILHAADDCNEHDTVGINQWIDGMYAHDSMEFLSAAPHDLGPVYVTRSRAVNIGHQGLRHLENGDSGTYSGMFKAGDGDFSHGLFYFRHVTFVSAADSAGWGVISGPQDAGSPTGPVPVGVDCANVIVLCTGYPMRMTDAAQVFSSRHGIYVTTSPTTHGLRYVDTVDRASTAEWEALTGATDTNLIDGVQVAPTAHATVAALFVDPSGGDVRLTEAAKGRVVGEAVPGLPYTTEPRPGYET